MADWARSVIYICHMRLVIVWCNHSFSALTLSPIPFINRMRRRCTPVFLIHHLVFVLRIIIHVRSYKHRLFYKRSISLRIFIRSIIHMLKIMNLSVCYIYFTMLLLIYFLQQLCFILFKEIQKLLIFVRVFRLFRRSFRRNFLLKFSIKVSLCKLCLKNVFFVLTNITL